MIAGYFGSGAAGHPNKGYQLFQPYGQGSDVQRELPRLGADPGHRPERQRRHGRVLLHHEQRQHGQRQLRVLGLDGRFHEVNFPTGGPASPPVDQLLGVNNHNVAVGFYTDARATTTATPTTSATASSAGAEERQRQPDRRRDQQQRRHRRLLRHIGGHDDAFLKDRAAGSSPWPPRRVLDQAFGVNDNREVVGTYTVGSGNNAAMHGFTWTARSTGSPLSMTRTASAPPPSTASTTTATWSGSTSTARATPTACSPRRSADQRERMMPGVGTQPTPASARPDVPAQGTRLTVPGEVGRRWR